MNKNVIIHTESDDNYLCHWKYIKRYSDYIVHTDNGDEYLVHYGRLGMKWGEHRFMNEDGSLTSRGSRKYARDSKKADKFERRSAKLRAKAMRKFAKADSHRYSRFGNKEKANRIMEKGQKQLYKANQYAERGERLYKKMLARYSNASVNNLSKDQIERGERLIRENLARMQNRNDILATSYYIKK